MSPALQIVLSGALSFGVPLAVAAGELAGLRRAGRGDPRRGVPALPDPPPPVPPAMRKPLPACLVPQLASPPARPRVLEPT